jgi:hypothetical protein
LREPEEENERQHFRVLGLQEPRNQEVIERQPDGHEHGEGDRKDGYGIDGEQREQPERQEGSQHQKVAVRQVDDAHDAEHEIEPEPDQGEIEAEQDAGEHTVEQHSARSAAGPA